jgi:hypothetical protein
MSEQVANYINDENTNESLMNNVIQAPTSIRLEDLPENLELNREFEINSIKYILVDSQKKDIKIVQENGIETGRPEAITNFYTIKRVF